MMETQFLGQVTGQGVAAFTEIQSHTKARTRKDLKFLPSEFEGTWRHLRGVDKWTSGHTGLGLRIVSTVSKSLSFINLRWWLSAYWVLCILGSGQLHHSFIQQRFLRHSKCGGALLCASYVVVNRQRLFLPSGRQAVSFAGSVAVTGFPHLSFCLHLLILLGL